MVVAISKSASFVSWNVAFNREMVEIVGAGDTQSKVSVV